MKKITFLILLLIGFKLSASEISYGDIVLHECLTCDSNGELEQAAFSKANFYAVQPNSQYELFVYN